VALASAPSYTSSCSVVPSMAHVDVSSRRKVGVYEKNSSVVETPISCVHSAY